MVAVDLGTTSAKVVAVDVELRQWAAAANAYAMHSDHPGWAEQDADEVTDAALRGLTDVLGAVRRAGATVAGVCLSAAMHSVLGVDAAFSPLTRVITYADSRALAEAASLRGSQRGAAMYRRTGVPNHPMAPVFKLAWMRDHMPDVTARVTRWISLKEYLLHRLGVEVVVDHSIASGTGLFDLQRTEWDSDALEFAGVDAATLSPLVPAVTQVAARDLDVPLVVGGGDGALSNLGAGALAEGIAALSIGTSAAIRVTRPSPRTDGKGRLFCAAVDGQRWVVGGAISNGGLVLRWLRDRLLGAGGPVSYDRLTELAQPVAPGSAGLLCVPYLTAERAPSWDGRIGAALLNLDLRHGAGHVVRAAMEGVALQLRWVADAMAESECAVGRIHASGGFTASPVWVQILADVLERDVVVPRESEGSSLGAALLGMVSLGMISDLDEAAARVPLGQVVAPREDNAPVYAAAYDAFREAASHVHP